MNQSKRKHESHQRPDAAASLPPRPGIPFPFGTHRAESIPLALPTLTHFLLSIPDWPPFPFHFERARVAPLRRFNTLVAVFAATTAEKSPVNKAR